MKKSKLKQLTHKSIQTEMDNNNNNDIISDITNEIIHYISDIIYTPTNTKKLQQFLNYIIKYLFNHISIYLYTIIALLIIIFIMNCSQFYYIIRKN
jgi:cellulose synthase/poly-beta-1,6-N-acetylglucosamine synthase-like glycosyltransferase